VTIHKNKRPVILNVFILLSISSVILPINNHIDAIAVKIIHKTAKIEYLYFTHIGQNIELKKNKHKA
jgi:hypothetical protein